MILKAISKLTAIITHPGLYDSLLRKMVILIAAEDGVYVLIVVEECL